MLKALFTYENKVNGDMDKILKLNTRNGVLCLKSNICVHYYTLSAIQTGSIRFRETISCFMFHRFIHFGELIITLFLYCLQYAAWYGQHNLGFPFTFGCCVVCLKLSLLFSSSYSIGNQISEENYKFTLPNGSTWLILTYII